MKDLASGLAATYIFQLPYPEETKCVPGRSGGEWIRGRFQSRRRQAFADYYRQPGQKGVEIAPHVLFARCPDTVESIIQFTNQWGPLHQPPQEDPGSGYDPSIFTESERKNLFQYFWFTPFWWRSLQQRFIDAMNRLAKPKWDPSETGLTEYIPMQTHTLMFGIERHRDVLAPKVRAGSLIESFWLMVWLDIAEGSRRLRMCANPRCSNRVFRTSRSDQIYCTEECRGRFNKRKNWAASGSEKRKLKRSRKKKGKRKREGPRAANGAQT
jgi:hypothetical protein